MKAVISIFFICSLLLLQPLTVLALSTIPDQSKWQVSDSAIGTVTGSDGILYVSGLFNQNKDHQATPPNMAVPKLNLMPKVDGIVKVSISDGQGGWFIGGDFDHVDDFKISNLAHIKVDNSLDNSFDPKANGPVDALALNASILYAGGQFNNIGGANRQFLAALDANSGLASSWNPVINGPIFFLQFDSSTLFLGGKFTTISGQARNNLAAVDLSGNLTSFNPSPNGQVDSLIVDGDEIFVAGNFNQIGGQSRKGIASLSKKTGLVTNWNPKSDGPVHSLAVNGPLIYVGGDFSEIGGENRNKIAALDKKTGLATSFNPNYSLFDDLLKRVGVAPLFSIPILAFTIPRTVLLMLEDLLNIIKNIPVLATRLIGSILRIIRRQKKDKPWGVVFDSLTKQPIDPAIVNLTALQGQTTKQIDQRITDFEGRFGFLIAAGKYILDVKKPSYIFPSKILAGKDTDGEREHLYFGGTLTFNDPDLIIVNIPLDQTSFNWNQTAKPTLYHPTPFIFSDKFINAITYLSFVLNLVFYFFKPTTINLILVLIYATMIILERFILKRKKWGRVYSSTTNEVLPLVNVKALKSNGLAQETVAATSTTDHLGRYYFYLDEGSYILQVEKSSPQGSKILKRIGPITVKSNNFQLGPDIEI